MSRKEINPEQGPDAAKRSLELAAYFTHCQLQPAHLQLSLRSAMTLAYKMKNFATASVFARRLLEQNPAPQVAQQVRKLQQVCDQTPTDAVRVDYDQHNPFIVCAASFEPVYRGSPVSKCAYCGAGYKPEYAGGVCAVCDVSRVGANGTGLRSALDGAM